MGRPSKSVFRIQKWQRIERGSRTKSWPCPAHPLQQRLGRVLVRQPKLAREAEGGTLRMA